MKIYGDLISPFVRMTIVTAHEAGLGGRVEHIVENTNPAQVNPRLATLSPIGKIPILETDHGHGLYDSRVIIEYLCHVAGNSTLIPDDGVKRFRVLTLQALGQAMADAAVAYRYETAARPKGLQWEDWMARTMTRLNAAMDDIEAELDGDAGGRERGRRRRGRHPLLYRLPHAGFRLAGGPAQACPLA
jgi:glutathione S-transferase